jgi:hypothetical protein
MKKFIFRMLFVCACVLAASVAAGAQELQNAGTALLQDTGKASVIVVRSAAKATWAVTKFAVKTTVKPGAKLVFAKAAPAAGKFALKKSAKHLLPLAVKFAAL